MYLGASKLKYGFCSVKFLFVSLDNIVDGIREFLWKEWQLTVEEPSKSK